MIAIPEGQTSYAPVVRVALYVRCSTTMQDVQPQLQALEQACRNHGWQVSGRYIDFGISGAKGREGRPQLDAMLKAAHRREFDRIAVWAVDRLGRSLRDLVNILQDLQAKAIDLYAHNQGIDTSTPTGRMMWGFLAVFADFERQMIRERVGLGLARARAAGKRLGRPARYLGKEADIVRLRAQGMGVLKIAKALRVGTGSVQRVIAAAHI